MPTLTAPALTDRTCAWCRTTGPSRLFVRYGRYLPLTFVCANLPACRTRQATTEEETP